MRVYRAHRSSHHAPSRLNFDLPFPRISIVPQPRTSGNIQTTKRQKVSIISDIFIAPHRSLYLLTTPDKNGSASSSTAPKTTKIFRAKTNFRQNILLHSNNMTPCLMGYSTEVDSCPPAQRHPFGCLFSCRRRETGKSPRAVRRRVRTRDESGGSSLTDGEEQESSRSEYPSFFHASTKAPVWVPFHFFFSYARSSRMICSGRWASIRLYFPLSPTVRSFPT